MTRTSKFLSALTVSTTLALAGAALAQDSTARSSTSTGVGTSVENMQNSGVTAGANSRINGSILTGSNRADTAVSTDVRNRTLTGGTSGRTAASTGVGTSVSTMQDSGINLGDNARVNGSILTGSNRANTSVGTAVNNDVRNAVNNRNRIATDANSRMETLQSTGVMIGKDGRINSGIVTEDNDARTSVGTSVSNRANVTGRKNRAQRRGQPAAQANDNAR